jgi:hypothetical protein
MDLRFLGRTGYEATVVAMQEFTRHATARATNSGLRALTAFHPGPGRQSEMC